MVKPPAELKRCYIHRDRIAIADCLNCGKPICSACVKESLIPRTCPNCSDFRGSDQKESGQKNLGRERIFEITVASEDEAAGVEPSGAKDLRDSELALPGEAGLKQIGESADATISAQEEHSLEILDEIRTPSEERETPKEAGGISAERVAGFETDIPRQLLLGFAYGMTGGIITYALWLFLASIRNNWSQLTVMTAGIMIPWFLFKGTTAKKRLGVPVYRKSPPAIWMALISLLIMLVMFPIAEYLAFKTAYTPSPTANPLGGFISQNFRGVDIAMIALGFLFSFGVPFFLKLGERPVAE